MFACHLHLISNVLALSLDKSRVCRFTFKHLPQPLLSLGLLKFSKKTFKKPEKAPPGARGSPNFFGVNIFFFCENEPAVQFQNSNCPPSKIFKKTPKIRPQGARGWGFEFYFFPIIFIIFF